MHLQRVVEQICSDVPLNLNLIALRLYKSPPVNVTRAELNLLQLLPHFQWLTSSQSAVVETGEVVIKASTSGTTTTATTGTVVSITFQPNTITTVFGVFNSFLSFFYYLTLRTYAIQDIVLNEQILRQGHYFRGNWYS